MIQNDLPVRFFVFSSKEEEAAKRHIPLFVTEMKLFIEAIQYQPDSMSFQNGTFT